MSFINFVIIGQGEWKVKYTSPPFPLMGVYIYIYLVAGLEHCLFFHILGISSSQLTFIFFRGVAQPPTRQYIYIYMYIYILSPYSMDIPIGKQRQPVYTCRYFQHISDTSTDKN